MKQILEIKHLHFSFDVDLLIDINMSIQSQEIVLINGKSGCGKSTLLRLIYGEIGDESQQNCIHLSGRKEKKPYQWKQSDWIGFVQQDPEMQICTNRIEDEIRFGLENLELDPTEIEARIDFYLQKLGLLDRRDQSVHSLSGGQKQRLILAAILAMQPKLILLDEPLAQLDSFGATDFIHFLDEIRQDQPCSFIIIEHRTEQLEPIANHKFTLQSGILDNFKPYPEVYQSIQLSRSSKTVLGVKNLCFQFEDVNILKDISFSINEGDTIALIGSNGSGKTTLIQSLANLLDYTGEVDITSSFHVVFQNPDLMLIENTVKQEIHDLTICKVLDLDKQLNQHPLILSKGQRLRTAIGSILEQDMDLLILDEPTSGQDVAHINQILSAIENCKIKSLLFCTHDMNLVKSIANRVIVLDRGELVFDGNYKDYLSSL